MKQKAHGFTIVELLIVIVVIAILAAITIVMYNGIQNRANDTRTTSGAKRVATAIHLWMTDNDGKFIKGGFGSSLPLTNGTCPDGGGNGVVGKGAYACTAEEVLAAAGYLPQNYIAGLPRNNYSSPTNGRQAIFLYQCLDVESSTTRYLLLWTMRKPATDWEDRVFGMLNECDNLSSETIEAIAGPWGMREAMWIDA